MYGKSWTWQGSSSRGVFFPDVGDRPYFANAPGLRREQFAQP